MLQWLVRVVLAVLVISSTPAPAGPTQRAGPLVLAASSLQEAMNAAADRWAAAGHPRPVISLAASSVLARQVAAGAQADLFASADEEWMDYLAERHLLATGSRAVLASNRLVLVAPAGPRLRVDFTHPTTLTARLGGGALAMADPDTVPAGRYGRAALEALNIWPAVARHVVRAENVRAALALVERGAAALGIVYATDARASTGVQLVGVFPARLHPPIRYPVARLAGSTNPEAERFRRFLLSPAARVIFARYGFLPG